MTREEAIGHVLRMSEFWSASGATFKADQQETREALRALGVTDAEIQEAEEVR